MPASKPGGKGTNTPPAPAFAAAPLLLLLPSSGADRGAMSATRSRKDKSASNRPWSMRACATLRTAACLTRVGRVVVGRGFGAEALPVPASRPHTSWSKHSRTTRCRVCSSGMRRNSAAKLSVSVPSADPWLWELKWAWAAAAPVPTVCQIRNSAIACCQSSCANLYCSCTRRCERSSK